MLVFLSDIHLTDGSSGETIKPTAFKIFSDNLQQLIESVKATKPLKELKIVLLGDIFDIIRSTRWLGAGVRPWSPAGSRQKTVVLDILNDIQRRNQESLNYFNTLRDYAARKNLPFEIRYVLGNHDWLINRYPETRDLVAGWLGMNLKGEKLPLELLSEEYRVAMAIVMMNSIIWETGTPHPSAMRSSSNSSIGFPEKLRKNWRADILKWSGCSRNWTTSVPCWMRHHGF